MNNNHRKHKYHISQHTKSPNFTIKLHPHISPDPRLQNPLFCHSSRINFAYCIQMAIVPSELCSSNKKYIRDLFFGSLFSLCSLYPERFELAPGCKLHRNLYTRFEQVQIGSAAKLSGEFNPLNISHMYRFN